MRGPNEVACILTANERPEATSLGLMRHNAIDVGKMASRDTELTFDPSSFVNKSLPCREMARIYLPASDTTVAINIINVAVTHGAPIAPFFTPEVAGFE
jgi:hypothetical protein